MLSKYRGKFIDWLRGTPTLKSGTMREWNEWRRIAKKKKFRYWLAEDGFDYLESFILWPFNKLKDIRYYLKNRYVDKTHALNSLLKKGEYHEFDTRILHCLFDELVYFIESEVAWLHEIVNDDKKSKELKLFKHRWFDIFYGYKNPDAGIAHLEWEKTLKFDDDWMDKNDPEYGKPTPQAIAAQEIHFLYKWWKEERPKRPDPYVASGWNDICENDETFWDRENRDPKRDEALEKLHKMEQDFDEEDTNMLIRLIKVRNRLWT